MVEIIRTYGFASESLEWQAWLGVVDLDCATPEQIVVSEESHPRTKTSDYHRSFIHQPEILRQRSVVFSAIMYTSGGLSHVEHELASAVVSHVDGCAYCAPVHVQRFEQFVEHNGMIRQAFKNPHIAGTNVHEYAIALLLIDLAIRPGDIHGEDPQPLKDASPTDTEILDLVHAVVIFAWTSRLVLNLGGLVSLGTA